jgi:peptidoglycan-N-acetylglucosamine deacetylase
MIKQIMIIFITFLLIILINYLIPHLVKKWWRRRFFRWADNSGKIYLTFDDGPDIKITGEILDFLKHYGIKATFFVLSVNVDKYPVVVKRMINEGHTLGLHGEKHLHPWKVFPWTAMKDLSLAKKYLEEIGIKIKYVRPPYGKLNIMSMIYIWLTDLVFIHWNIDPKDYNQFIAENLTRDLVSDIKIGKVVLLHDGRQVGTSPGSVTSKGIEGLLRVTNLSSDIFSQLPVNGLN